MRTLRRKLLIAAAACLAAPAAWAAVDNSHHDLRVWSGGSTQEVCYWCHGVTDTYTSSTNYGNVGDLCVRRCHAGAGGANFASSATEVIPNIAGYMKEDGTYGAAQSTVDAVNVTDAYAHGLDKTDLVNPDTGAAVALGAVGQTFPYGAGAVSMECTSCHDVHNNANTPFLHTNLFDNGTGGVSFCGACHGERGNSWGGGDGTTTEVTPNGEHPVDLALDVTSNVLRTLGGRIARYIKFDTATTGERVFDVTSANGAALNAPGTHYTTGGKVSTWGAAADNAVFGCYTCHAVHVPPIGGTAPTGLPNLVLRQTVSANGQWNPLCVACHGAGNAGSDSTEQNPGALASAFFHPTGPNAPAALDVTNAPLIVFPNSVGTGTFEIGVSLGGIIGFQAPAPQTNGGVGIETTTYRPRCTSCHDVHGGDGDSMAVADLDGTEDGATAGAVCYQCHKGADLADQADGIDGGAAVVGGERIRNGAPATFLGSHHRTRAGDSDGAITDADGDALYIDTASWNAVGPTGDRFGDLTDGMSCPDCHMFTNNVAGSTTVGQMNGTAHNWD